tara:strand:+ start:701 stop:871 length:171 start_codon:yes stop_codon:yes gene_type:complete
MSEIYLFTEYKKRIDPDMNEVFTDLLKAYRYAQETRSYHYQVFDNRGKHYGYAVPK